MGDVKKNYPKNDTDSYNRYAQFAEKKNIQL